MNKLLRRSSRDAREGGARRRVRLGGGAAAAADVKSRSGVMSSMADGGIFDAGLVYCLFVVRGEQIKTKATSVFLNSNSFWWRGSSRFRWKGQKEYGTCSHTLIANTEFLGGL